ncbi:DNA helicase RecG, partial [Candidatus Parcubacteria bacterium]
MPPRLTTNLEIDKLHSIADKLERDLKKIGIKTIADLLWYFPWRYDDLSQIKKISELEENEISTIKVKVKNMRSYRSFRKKMMITEMLAGDETDDIKAIWFRQKFVSQIIKPGDEIYLSGKPQKKNLVWQLTSPVYEKVKNIQDEQIHSARLVPMYHLSGKITQKQLRFLMSKAIKDTPEIEDPLPVEILNKEKYPWLDEAIKEIHFPSDENKLKLATKRLKFQELFYLQCKYRLAKQDYQAQKSYKISPHKETLNQTVNKLPFQLTMDQQSSLADILADLQKDHPMNRLVEGDVGSGKTVVAMLAALATISADFQTALMAPTEILANQHFVSAKKIIPKKYHSQIVLFTRAQILSGDDTKLSKKEINAQIKNGKIKFIIGTHSLIQEKVNYKNLAMAIIDEQHRFGVGQRQGLKNKNLEDKVPHLLSMTATPIPRTLSLTLYGDLDISLIKEKPAGRKAVKTFL